MIMAKPKPIEEIIDEIKDFKKVLIAGCDGCVTVCEAGGIKEVQVLASALRLYFTKESSRVEIDETSLTRQCDKEYLHELLDTIDDYDAVFPGVDTCFIGVTEERGVWAERCQACGQCILASTGGICPITRCSKRMMNGPCGGSEKGKCEVSPDTDCGWHLIYERLKELGQLDFFAEPTDPKDWASSRDGGPRKIVREDVRP
jgi:ferredoxin